LLKHSVFIRADGNASKGLGHVIRGLSLAEMLNDTFDCVFVIVEPMETIKAMIEPLAKLHSLRSPKDLTWLENINAKSDVVLLDGYDFDAEYQQHIKQFGIKLVMIDDNADMNYYADLIINHGSSTIVSKYRKEALTKVLAGFDYLILRKAFLNAAKKQRQIDHVDTVLICMGGADPKELSRKYLLAALNSGLFSKVNIILGGANDTCLEDVYYAFENFTVDIHRNINAIELIDLILESQIVISPASTISLEVCCVKAGLLTGTMVNNQENILRQLIDHNCCSTIGNLELASEENIILALTELANVAKINTMMRNQQTSIDGDSHTRVTEAIKALLN
jgi:UDP-2,4-diacetamido-2,4,6-trideoxy-beta-L-altropyranose hydrolase